MKTIIYVGEKVSEDIKKKLKDAFNISKVGVDFLPISLLTKPKKK